MQFKQFRSENFPNMENGNPKSHTLMCCHTIVEFITCTHACVKYFKYLKFITCFSRPITVSKYCKTNRFMENNASLNVFDPGSIEIFHTEWTNNYHTTTSSLNRLLINSFFLLNFPFPLFHFFTIGTSSGVQAAYTVFTRIDTDTDIEWIGMDCRT